MMHTSTSQTQGKNPVYNQLETELYCIGHLGHSKKLISTSKRSLVQTQAYAPNTIQAAVYCVAALNMPGLMPQFRPKG